MEDILMGENYKTITKDLTSPRINNIIYDFLQDAQTFLEYTLSSEKLSRLALVHRSRLVTKLSSLIKEYGNHKREIYTDTLPAIKSFLSDASNSVHDFESEPEIYDVPYGESVSDFDRPVVGNQCDASSTTNPLQPALETKKKGIKHHLLKFGSKAFSLSTKALQNRSPLDEHDRNRRENEDSNILYDDALTPKQQGEEELSYDYVSVIPKNSEIVKVICTNDSRVKTSEGENMVYDDASKVDMNAYEPIPFERELQKKDSNGISSASASAFSSVAINRPAPQNRSPTKKDNKIRRKNKDSDKLNDNYPLPPQSEKIYHEEIFEVSTIPKDSKNVSQIINNETIVKISEKEYVVYDDACKVNDTNKKCVASESIPSIRELQNNNSNSISMNSGASGYRHKPNYWWYMSAPDAKAQALRYGYMKRRLGRKLLSTWRHCYCVLLPSHLFVYDNDVGKSPQIVIGLSVPNIKVKYFVKLGVDCKRLETHSFVLFHGDRVLCEMSTTSRDETEEWLMALHIEAVSHKK